MSTGDERPETGAKHNWKKIGLIAGGVLLVLTVIGAATGDPEAETVAVDKADSSKHVTAESAPNTTEAPTTTVAPTTSAAPTTTPAPTTTAAPPPPPPPPPPTVPPTTAPDPYAGETVSQSNARRTAQDYLAFSAFSRSGLIRQLVYEGFSDADASYGVDVLRVDWYDQAAKSAASYLAFTSFSRSGLIEQLVYEGFTQAEAEHGVGTTGL